MKTIVDCLTEADWEECREPDGYARVRGLAIRYIGVARRRTSGRVSAHLADKGIAPDIISIVISDLERDGYIDDYKLACAVVRERRGRKAEGERALRFRMRGLGMKGEAIELAIDEEPIDDTTRVREFLETKCEQSIVQLANMTEFSETGLKIKSKVLRACGGRGFELSVALPVFDALVAELRDSLI
ncbi:MAG: hypothetical protein ACOX2M_04715 [Fastidiosipilaceae bacterium]